MYQTLSTKVSTNIETTRGKDLFATPCDKGGPKDLITSGNRTWMQIHKWIHTSLVRCKAILQSLVITRAVPLLLITTRISRSQPASPTRMNPWPSQGTVQEIHWPSARLLTSLWGFVLARRSTWLKLNNTPILNKSPKSWTQTTSLWEMSSTTNTTSYRAIYSKTRAATPIWNNNVIKFLNIRWDAALWNIHPNRWKWILWRTKLKTVLI